DRGRPRPLGLSEPRAARGRAHAAGGDGDVRQGDGTADGMALRLLLTGGAMDKEGVVFPPVPVPRQRVREAARPGRVAPRDAEPRCEMCGSLVIASHCKRICLHCGFMTGCSEGI